LSEVRLPTVADVMTRGVVTCALESTIEDVAKLMVEKDIRSLVVENKIGNPVGMVTSGDIVKSVAKRLKPSTKVSDIVSKELISIDSQADIVEAAELMNAKGIERLAVTEEGRVTGIVTTKDVLKYSPRYLHEFSITLEKLERIIKNL